MARRLAGLLLVVLALAGCNGDSKADDPPKSPSPSSSPSKSEAGPKEPELASAARQPTKEAAVEFVQHYWAMVDYVSVSGEVGELRKLAAADCERCSQGADALEQLHDAGGVLRGVTTRMTSVTASVTVLPQADKRQTAAIVKFAASQTPGEEFYGDGDSRNKTWPEGRLNGEFLLYWLETPGRWQIMSLEAR